MLDYPEAKIFNLCLSMWCSYLIICLFFLYSLSEMKLGYAKQNDKLNVYSFNNTKGIKICCHNVNRMSNKFEEIRYNLLYSENPPDIIGCCETFYNEHITDNEIQINNYITQRKDRTHTGGGGWAVYFSENLHFERKINFENENLETMWFEVKPNYKKSFLLCFVYRPPQSVVNWINLMEEEIAHAINYNPDITLMGNFNFDFLCQSKVPRRWVNMLETYNFQQIIKDPTRVTATSKTLLDHIYVTNSETVHESHVIKYPISDHFPIGMTRKEQVCHKKHTHTTISYRNFKKFDEKSFVNDLSKAPFHFIEYENDPSVCLQLWYDLLNSVLDKHAPIVSKRVKKDVQPAWYTSDIIHARRMRDKYHNLGLWGEYKYWRNRTNQILDNSKQKYYSNIVKESKDVKTLWKCIHSFNPSHPVRPHELLKENNEKTKNIQEITNIFNDFFTTCVQKLRDDKSPTVFNSDKLRQFVEHKMPSNEKFTIPPVKISDLMLEINKLDGNKSAGSDNIGPRILKLCSPYIVSSLTYIFNKIIDSGIFPDFLKNAQVSPIYKDGERCLATNYRPISVLPTISKLLEKHISKHMYKFLSKHNLLHPAQSGFRPGHSCQTALINIVDKWLEAMDNGNVNIAVLLDLKKAFDVVDHEILLKKLNIYGCNDSTLCFFKSYLSGRTQQVKIGNTKSKKLYVCYGVPQGSILGPLLFILYINDLPLYIKNSASDMYADDTTIHLCGRDLKTLECKMQADLFEIQKWCDNNNMFINCNKTKCMVIGTRQNCNARANDPVLYINDNILQNSPCEKLLGVKIDSHLCWGKQVDLVCSKISSRIYLLSKIKKFLNLESRKLYYSGFILPLMDYCCVIWGNCYTENLNRILKLQKRAARLILDADPLAPSAPLFQKLGWMRIEDRILYHKCILIFKCLQNNAPSYLKEKISLVSENNPYQLRNVINGDLKVPMVRNELYKKSFSYSGPYIWNNLPNSIRSVKTISAFKEKLKHHLIINSNV